MTAASLSSSLPKHHDYDLREVAATIPANGVVAGHLPETYFRATNPPFISLIPERKSSCSTNCAETLSGFLCQSSLILGLIPDPCHQFQTKKRALAAGADTAL